MDRSPPPKQNWSWLPQHMPGVARLMKQRRAEVGDAWVNECWKHGVLELEPGWFWAGEGALMVGSMWDDPQILTFATSRITRTQACLVLREPNAAADASSPDPPPVAGSEIAAKVAYVKTQGQTRNHHCHWPGCDRQVPPAMWGCKAHWYRLPTELRDEIWKTFKPGQEVDLSPSRAYLAAADKVQAWIREHGGAANAAQ